MATIREALLTLKAGYESETEPLTMFDDQMNDAAEIVTSAYDELLAAIDERDKLLSALRGLLDWADHMGGWEARCWRRAKATVRAIGRPR